MEVARARSSEVLWRPRQRTRIGDDLDVRVVAQDGVHRIRTSQAIYRALSGLGQAADIVVVTEGDVRRDLGKPGTIITPALEEGRDLYAAPI